MFQHGYCLDGDFGTHSGIVHQEQEAPNTIISILAAYARNQGPPSSYIFLISRLGMFMQPMMSGKRATMSLLLMVMLATIFLRATFLTE